MAGFEEPEQERAGRPLAAVTRALCLLRVLAETEEVSFGGLRSALKGMPAPTLSRLLKTLTSAGYVRKTAEGRYGRGRALDDLGCALGESTSPKAAVREVLSAFAAETGESIAFARLWGGRLVLTEKEEVPDSFKLVKRGFVFRPSEKEGPTIAAAAHLPEKDFLRFIRSPGSLVVSPAEFRRLARRCRREGIYEESLPGRPPVGGPRRFCVPVLDGHGVSIGELHTVRPGGRSAVHRKRFVARLPAAARRLEECFSKGRPQKQFLGAT